MNTTPTTSRIDPSTVNSDFVQRQATKPLRVCCYGSSSSETPLRYLSSARSLGYILAKRGHTCVNGAGAYGCMAAMNDGADIGEGHIVGVIHEMWLQKESNVRDGGAHQIFLPQQQQQRRSTENSAAIQTSSASSNNETLPTTTTTSWTGPKHELLVAGGNDLQERKRLLVEKADALIVLPGGPGTWDELWEMACARGIGLSTIPIVCVNCDGYYEPFHEMLVRAYNDRLTKFLPHELVHFEATAEAAVQWVEATCSGTLPLPPATATTTAATSWKKKSSLLRKSSMMHVPDDGKGTTGRWWTFRLPYNHWNYKDSNRRDYEWMRTTILITTGIAFGVTFTTAMTRWIVVKR